MLKIEKLLWDFVQKHLILLAFIAVTGAGVALHCNGHDFLSGDLNCYLVPWWNEIAGKGIEGLASQVGNYNIPYQIIIFLLSRTNMEPVIAYKLVSIVFDFALALSAALLTRSLSKSKFAPLIAYAAVLCSFNTWLNSCFWGQCDSIYVTFIVLAIFFLFKEKHIPSFIMLGLALAFKLQVIFILPAVFYYYVSTRKVSLLHFLIVPAVNFLLCMPAVFCGRPFNEIFTVYLEQTETYHQIQMNCPNVYALMMEGNNTIYFENFKPAALALTALMLTAGLVFVLKTKVSLDDPRSFFMAAVWSSYTMLIFMPAMHERYSYLPDLLIILFAVIWCKYIWAAILCNFISLRGYCFYLFSEYQMADIRYAAIALLAVYIYLTAQFARDFLSRPCPEPPITEDANITENTNNAEKTVNTEITDNE